MANTVLKSLVILTAVLGGGYLVTTSTMSQIRANEMSCKITQVETIKGSSNELLIHTDGCSDTATKEHTFRADRDKLAASFTDPAFTVADFYKGAAAGKTYNLTIQGVASKPLNIIPEVVKVTEDYMPY